MLAATKLPFVPLSSATIVIDVLIKHDFFRQGYRYDLFLQRYQI